MHNDFRTCFQFLVKFEMFTCLPTDYAWDVITDYASELLEKVCRTRWMICEHYNYIIERPDIIIGSSRWNYRNFGSQAQRNLGTETIFLRSYGQWSKTLQSCHKQRYAASIGRQFFASSRRNTNNTNTNCRSIFMDKLATSILVC